MVSVLDSSAVDLGFGSNQTIKIGICCFSAKHAAFKEKERRLTGSEYE